MIVQADPVRSLSEGPQLDRVRTFPRYGIDGPAFAWGFFVAAGVLTAFGLWFSTQTQGWPVGIGVVLLITALVPLVLGSTMLSYAIIGKQRLRDHLLRQRAWRGDETGLDIGAGRGLMAIGMAKRAPQGRIIALDLWSAKDLTGNTPEGLKENCAIENVGNVEIVTGDASKLDLPDASIDVVASVFCLHNIEPEAARIDACREIARVLRPDGVALIADFPSAAPYVETFRAAGLTVDGPHASLRIALGISGYLVARK